MPTEEVAKRSDKVLQKLLEILDLSSISSLHTYLPLKGQNEVDTQPLLKYIWQEYPRVKTATWQGAGEAAVSIWLDRRGNTSVAPINFQFDVIIVPVLGFDKANHRLGLGGGFYDRFLSSQLKAKKIGLAYDLSLVNQGLPSERHDIALDCIVTETKTYLASSKQR